MSQQINLLVREEVGPALSALRALIGLGVMLAVFLAYGAFAWLSTARLGDTVAQSDAQMAAERVKRQELEQKLAARPKREDILAEINAIKPQADESQEIANLLSGSAGGSAGYLSHFATLARTSEEGVWLTGIKISNTGKTVSLAGRSLHNESVLKYAQRLNEQFGAFGVQFSSVELTPDVVKESPAAPGLSSVTFKLF